VGGADVAITTNSLTETEPRTGFLERRVDVGEKLQRRFEIADGVGAADERPASEEQRLAERTLIAGTGRCEFVDDPCGCVLLAAVEVCLDEVGSRHGGGEQRHPTGPSEIVRSLEPFDGLGRTPVAQEREPHRRGSMPGERPQPEPLTELE
jgi:hypothetical protein